MIRLLQMSDNFELSDICVCRHLFSGAVRPLVVMIGYV